MVRAWAPVVVPSAASVGVASAQDLAHSKPEPGASEVEPEVETDAEEARRKRLESLQQEK